MSDHETIETDNMTQAYRCATRTVQAKPETVKTTDTMQKSKNTMMHDASECVPRAPCGSHAPRRLRKHAAKRNACKTKPRRVRPNGLGETSL